MYRIASESPLQLVSEHLGRFNEDMPLSPGSYLVLADCSFESVTIYPDKTKTLDVYEVNFIPPHPPKDGDIFSVQCSRYDKIGSRQNTSDRYSLKILEGQREILVGMVPLKVDLSESATGGSKVLTYPLSAIRVESQTTPQPTIPYFVSPIEGTLSITQSQQFGKWEFLLPGRYRLELHGTELEIDLKKSEERTVNPASLLITTAPNVHLDLAAQITGSPLFLEINSDHWLALNENYPVLPGKTNIRLSGSSQKKELTFEEGKSYKLEPKSVMVDLGCAPGDRPCLGSREVFLYRLEEPYPFAKGVSNVPLLYFDEQVFLGIEGARDIRLELAKRDSDVVIKTGKLEFLLDAVSRPGQITDLVRIDTTGAPLTGHSVDFPMDRKLSMYLFPGHYRLEHFVTVQNVEGERKKFTTNFSVEAGTSKKLDVTLFLSEKKLAAFNKETK